MLVLLVIFFTTNIFASEILEKSGGMKNDLQNYGAPEFCIN